MKKKLFIIILITILLGAVIVINDYYHAIPVQRETVHEEIDIYNQLIDTKEDSNNQDASICITGDNLIHESVYQWAKQLAERNSQNNFDFRPIYADIEPIVSSADFSIVNQSSLIAANKDEHFATGYPLFCSPSELGHDLLKIGFDGVNPVNNHMLDYGEIGLFRSLNFWEEQDATVFGHTLTDTDQLPYENCIIVVNGIRIAVLSYTEHTNGILTSGNTEIPYYCYKQGSVLQQMLTEDVSSCAQISDFVIVLMNWGNSSGYEPSQKQIEAAQVMCDAGADMIIGTGSKVLQPVVELHSEKHDGRTICFYSLGNLMGTMDYMDNLFGGLLFFKITKTQDDAYLSEVKFHPTVIYYDDNKENVEVLRLENYSSRQNLKHGSNIKFGMTDIAWFDETLRKYIGNKYL